MSNVIRFPAKLTATAQNSSKRLNEPYLDLDLGYKCEVITAAGIEAAQHGLLPKDTAAWSLTPPAKDYIGLNILRKDETVVASMIVDTAVGLVEATHYRNDLKAEDTAAISSLLLKRQWAKLYKLPEENFIYATDGRCYSFKAMPDVLHIRGGLEIKGADNVHFPLTLTMTRDLRIDSSQISRAPSYLQAHTVKIVNSRLPTVAAVLKCERLQVEYCAIDQICGIGNIKEDLMVLNLATTSDPPSMLRVGGRLFASTDSFADLPSGATVMGKIAPRSVSEHLPWSTDFLGRVLRHGDYVRFLQSVTITRNGRESTKSVQGFAARFVSGNEEGGAVLALEDGSHPDDVTSAPSSAVLRTDEGDFGRRRITYAELFPD